jgi:hypothetical protein
MADQICEELIQSVGKHGVSHVEVARGAGNDFTVSSISRSPMARCTVTLLDHEPTFTGVLHPRNPVDLSIACNGASCALPGSPPWKPYAGTLSTS